MNVDDTPRGFKHTITHTHEWLSDFKEYTGIEDPNDAFALLRAFLITVRNRLPAGEAMDLGAQLPALLRGFYFEGWSPYRETTKERTVTKFIESVRRNLKGHDHISLDDTLNGAFQFIFDKVSAGEVQDIKKDLPKKLEVLWKGVDFNDARLV